MHLVPNISQVVPGAPVSIVLKADQPTGNEVQGIVAELLTRGDHPRGIKVRLKDGRVGRVQRMVSEETAKEGSEGLSGLGRNGELGMASSIGVQTASGPSATPIGGFTGRRYGDFRIEEPDESPSAGLSLSDYVVTKTKTKKGQKKAQNALKTENSAQDDDGRGPTTDVSNSTTMARCPVCDEFEGDEAAVVHHVNMHFE